MNKNMKKLFLIAALMVAVGIKAQKITVVDNEGYGVAYASVLNSDGRFIGITSLEGVLEDAKGATNVIITHVAFNPKEVALNGRDVRVTLEDADFALEEIVVSPKPITYVQTYYRAYFYTERHGIYYYRAGLTDNIYDREHNKLTSDTKHFTMGLHSVTTKLLNMTLGKKLDHYSEIQIDKMEDYWVNDYKDIQLKISPLSPGQWEVSDIKGKIGTITDDKSTGRRHYVIDSYLAAKHRIEAEGNTKKNAKREKTEEQIGNESTYSSFIYQIDQEGNYSPEDFIMKELHSTFNIKIGGDTLNCILGYQAFTTDRAYVTKDELKTRREANKMKMTYGNAQKFEKENDIPALPQVIEQAINKMVNK